MSLVTIQDPLEEPVTLDRVKAHCRVDGADDDALLGDYIAAARREVEAFTRRRLVSQVVEYRTSTLDPGIRLPLAPVQSVDAIEYLAQDGSAQALALGRWRLIGGASAPYVLPAVLETWPHALGAPDSVTIRMTAGYGDVADVPSDLKVAVLQLVAHYYSDREGGGAGTGMPAAAEAILRRHILWL